MKKILVNKMREWLVLSMIFAILFIVLIVQVKHIKQEEKNVVTLYDIAFDTNKKHGYKIFLSENGQLEPYFVVTNDYYGQGNVLLLREYVWDTPMKIQERSETSYYATSFPDDFLNREFIHRFSEELREKIPTTRVLIRDNRFVDGSRSFERIQRKLFLLSLHELSPYTRKMWDEPSLEFFRQIEYIKAFLIDDWEGNVWKRETYWWLRSDMTGERIFTNAVTDKGKLTLTSTQSELYIRPALTLPPKLPVERIEINGESIFVLQGFDFETVNEKVFVQMKN